ncbi:MAG: hypothetical protein DCF19_17440 [Pseudanabaena frigida]|uniref:DUF3131 domain-containing protein n=1 Tax=Pseudanabaena frigida TaxID=945775 RepID=A0A2W4Y3X8_9CYAN|nr:MAG: hypothetical protein DCF19_17440 [Pseudanabaena frigida]
MKILTSQSQRFWLYILCGLIFLTAWGTHQILLWHQSTAIPAPVVRRIPLSEDDRQLARSAWRYFELNRQPTGLVSSAAFFPATTMWDIASQFAGMTAARELGMLPADEFDRWMAQSLTSLSKIKLYNNELPNKAYNAATLQPVNYGKLDAYQEIGFSALDIGRLGMWLDLISARYPQHKDAIKTVTARWNLTRLSDRGQLMGTDARSGKEEWQQEGRLGYEQYGAYGLTKLGLQPTVALNPNAEMTTFDILGVAVPVDRRTTYHNYVTSEPYILDGLESGFKALPAEFAARVLQVQQRRYWETKQLTAWSEDNLDRAPWFVYNSIFVDGQPWKTLDSSGKDASAFRGSSTKAAVGWNMLFRTSYTERVYKGLRGLADPERGVFAGYYEETQEPNRALTLNTNGIILEALLYSHVGKPLEEWANASR